MTKGCKRALLRLAKENPYREVAGFLTGRHYRSSGRLVVSGVAGVVAGGADRVPFSAASAVDGAVGWFHSHPGAVDLLSPSDLAHVEAFPWRPFVTVLISHTASGRPRLLAWLCDRRGYRLMRT